MRGQKNCIEERIYQAGWHLLIGLVGIYELKHHRTTLSKILSCGLIAFHVDGAIADIIDAPPLSRRLLDVMRPIK